MIGISAILTKCQWLPFKWDLQKAKFALALPLSKGTPFIVSPTSSQHELRAGFDLDFYQL